MGVEHHTIESGIVIDALHCLADKPLPQSYIGGGMSLQFSLPSELHRHTSDIDLTTSNLVDMPEWRKFVLDSLGGMTQRGYDLSFRKERYTLDAHLERDGQHLVIQVPRRNSRNFEKRRSILEREVEHARQMPYGEGNLSLIAYEDLVAHKVVRGTAFKRAYGLKDPQTLDLQDLKGVILEKKEKLQSSLYALSPEEIMSKIAEIRLHADVFDVRAVFTHCTKSFDERYFKEAIDSFGEYNGEKASPIADVLSFYDSLTKPL